MNLNKTTAKAVLLLKTQSQWQGLLFCKKQDNKLSSSKVQDSSCSSWFEILESFLVIWFSNDVITLCSLVARVYACIELRVKYFFPKPFRNFT